MTLSNKYYSTIKKICKNPWLIFPYAGTLNLLNWMPDSWYLKGCFRAKMGYRLNLKSPETYNEKLQWLKLHDRDPIYTQMVDKYLVREYIKKVIGDKYLIPLLGVWDSFDDIDFTTLPNQFVMKTNHDSGTVVVCKDKSTFDIDAARQKINKSINYNYYYLYREWPYKNIPHKIIIEKYLVDETGNQLIDYKFYTFNGEVKAVLIAMDRLCGELKFDCFDADFNRLKMTQDGHPNANIFFKKPDGFETMKKIAEILSKGIPHLRVDFYNVYGAIYVGELTFSDSAGFLHFDPVDWDKIFGDWIVLPSNKK